LILMSDSFVHEAIYDVSELIILCNSIFKKAVMLLVLISIP